MSTDLQARLDALPEWPETFASDTELYDIFLRFVMTERDAALARLAPAREWIADSPHMLSCEMNSWEFSTPCTCGRDGLLKKLEVPK
jgi:hypothetical protein